MAVWSGLLRRLFAICLPDPIKEMVDDTDFADTIRGQQMHSIVATTPSLLAVTALNLFMTAYVVMDIANPLILSIWVAIGLAVVIVGTAGTFKTFRRQLKPRPVKSSSRAVTNAALLGLIWAVLPILFFADASGAQRVFMTCVVAGMMGGGAIALSMLPAAAGVMCLTIGTGAMIALLMSGDSVLYLACLMVINYGFAIMQTVRGHGQRFVQSFIDQHEIKKSGETISLLLKDFQNNSSDWIWETDAEGRFVDVSARFADVSGRDIKTLEQTKLSDLVMDALEGERRRDDVASPAVIDEIFDKQKPFRELTFSVRSQGDLKWWICSGHPTFDSKGQFTGYRGVGSDISKRKKAEFDLAQMARFDQLTGLCNRTEFVEQLRKEIALLRPGGRPIAVLYLDLDKFKSINDAMGHAVGDAVLAEAARRIEAQIRETDLAARFGGDEFVIVAQCPNGVDDAISLSERIACGLDQPFDVDGHRMMVGTSIGIVMSDMPSDVPETLIHNADLALYRAKAEGRGMHKLFAKEMDDAKRERLEMEVELRDAVSRDELEIHYQPLVNIGSGKVIGFEALLRWNNPKRGRVAPDDFISIAEETGLIHEIGDWVIAQACRDAKGWPNHQRVAVNLSGKQLQSHRLVQRVVKELADSGLAPHRLELEVTETVLINDPDMALKILTNLRELGVHISLDDFGTGYSSLSYLVRFPFNKLKIDKSFVQSAISSPQHLAIIRSILGLTKELNIVTLAEGVETQEQFDLLRDEGCEEAQGFLLSKPKALADITEFQSYSIAENPSAFSEARSLPPKPPILRLDDEKQSA